MEAMQNIEEEEVDVPNDSEMVQLWGATILDKPSEVKRLFVTQLGYNFGLRGNRFERMEPKVFETGSARYSEDENPGSPAFQI